MYPSFQTSMTRHRTSSAKRRAITSPDKPPFPMPIPYACLLGPFRPAKPHHNSTQKRIRAGAHTAMQRIFCRSLKRLVLILVVSLILFVALGWPNSAYSQDTPTAQPVWVEAIKTANLRAGPGLEFAQIGTISAGTKYRMVGRSARARWYLIALQRSLGWVYMDLVTVIGDINTVSYDETIITIILPTDTPNSPTETDTPVVEAHSATAYVTPTLPGPTDVSAEAINASIVRFGPGSDFARVGRIFKGQA
jgi:uncharacterized protein YraI